MTGTRWRSLVLVLAFAMVAVACGRDEEPEGGSTGQQLTLETLNRVGLEPSDLQPGYEPRAKSGLKAAREW